MKLTPWKGTLIAQVDELPKTTEGGLHIPEAARRSPPTVEGMVVESNCLIKKGDMVLFRVMDSLPFEWNGMKLYSVKDEKIIATIEED